MTKKIYVIAGEASGDLHGSNLILSLKSRSPEPLEIYGAGGDKIRQTGAREFLDLAHFHVTGFTEAIRKFPLYKQAAWALLARIKKVRPDLVVLIDNPGLNLHLAQKIHTLKIPIVYYIAPQVWAWAPNRILKIKRTIKKVLVVFEFEKKIYEENGIPVAWVGHPLRDLVDTFEKHANSKETPLEKNGLLVSLLPGSRKGELKMLFSIFLKAARILSERFKKISFALIKSPALPKEFYQRLMDKNGVPVSLIEENSYGVIKSSDLSIVCSGTATLECALLGSPMIISNRSSFLTYLAAKNLIKVPYLGLPNLILGQKKIPELLQYEASPEKIADQAIQLLTDKTRADAMRKDLRKVCEKLGEAGASDRAAVEILSVLNSHCEEHSDEAI